MSHKETGSSMEKQCLAYSVSLNKIRPEYDGQWQGIIAASDGACYFGSSTHSYRHGAGFFRFDPRSRELSMLAEDMTEICGEDLTRTPPQGKIHSSPCTRSCTTWTWLCTRTFSPRLAHILSPG